MAARRFLQKIFATRYVLGLSNLALFALWGWLFRAVYPYLKIIFSAEEFRTNQVVLVGVVALIVLQVRQERPLANRKAAVNYQPQLFFPALGMALGSAVLYLLVERFLDINTLSATLFGLGSYGLLGLWMNPERWRKGLPAALLLVGALPFGDHIQTFIGYPVRILTASIVKDGLSAVGVHSINLDTILVFENGISKVDLPCSGVKSLWTGALFFLAATWINRRPINLRWILAGVAFALALLAANLLRVAVLVTVGEVAGWRLLAEMLHVPLGVIGFAGACLLGLALLRKTGQWQVLPRPVEANPPELDRPRWLTPLLGGLLVGMALLYSARPETVFAQPQETWRFPPDLATKDWPLTEGELAWLEQSDIQDVERMRFEWRGMTGSVLMVSSTNWRAHHRPERCFEVYGLSASETRTALVAQDFPIRLLTLGNQDNPALLSAAYWLQSQGRVTDDYATRIWDDLTPQRKKWVLVTVLFDTPLDSESEDTRALYAALREAVLENLLDEVNHE